MKQLAAVAALALSLAFGVARAAPVESFVEAPGPQGALKGTLLTPGPRTPVVLLIPGSGAVDRDDNGGPVKAGTLKLLAEGLAERGIASVRVDKRGLYASAAAGDANSATVEEMGKDAHAWARVLTAKLGVRCIWLAGHSEGGAVAIAAAQDPSQICGLALISTAGRRLSDVIRDQLSWTPGAGPLIPAVDAILSKLENGEHVAAADIPAPLMRLFHPLVQDKLIADFQFAPRLG